MTYYTCLTCPEHSTIDHDLRGKGPCLFPECPCQKMVEGAVFVKKVYVRKTRGQALKDAAERGEKEPE